MWESHYSHCREDGRCILHRGPDDSGGVIMMAGGTASSPVDSDLSPAGHQPGVGSGFVIVFIYNHLELRKARDSFFRE